MALERFRSGGAHGIARFLHDHQRCDAGFEVSRSPGSGGGRLSVVCKGCGQGIAYRAAAPGELGAGSRTAANGDSPEPEQVGSPAPAAPPGARGARPRGPAAARGADPGRRFPRSPGKLLIAALIIGGAALIAIGLLRSGAGRGEATETAAPPAPSGTVPSGTAPGEADPAAPATAPPVETTPQRQSGAGRVRLRRRRFEAFAIGVPPGWRVSRGDAIAIAAPGGVAAVTVFFEPGRRSSARVAEGAARYLAGEHAGARVSAARPARLAGRRAREVTATYPGGVEKAIVLVAEGYVYLVLTRRDRGASSAVAEEAGAATRSFTPR